MQPIKICLILPVWGRQQITRLCFQNIKRIVNFDPERFSISPFVIVSEDWVKELCSEFGFTWHETENKPLGRKMNEGLRQVIDDDFDWLMGFGSDDFVEPDFLDEYVQYFDSLKNFGLNEVFLINETTGTQKRHNVGGRVFGALRCIHWDVLKLASFDGERFTGIWDDTQNRMLDMVSTDNIFMRTGSSTRPINIDTMLWDVKGSSNINRFENVEGERVRIPKEEMPKEIQHLCNANP